MTAFSFRRLTVADLPMLHEWLNRPHVAEWWDDRLGWEEVRDDFTAELDNPKLAMHIAYQGDTPIGYIQSYVVMGSGDGWWEHETDPGARGTDQFLADPASLGRGLGTAMIRAFVDTLFADPAVTRVQVDPAPDNARAIACYRKAGFRDVGLVDTPDGPAWLLSVDRADWT